MKFAGRTHAHIYGYVIAMMTDDEFDAYLRDYCEWNGPRPSWMNS